MTEKRKSQIILYGALAFLLILAALAANFGRPLVIRQIGIEIKPGDGVSYAIPDNIVYYRQDDARWRSQSLGNSEYTIGSSGGLVCCVATALNYFSIDADPLTVNNAFTDQGVFSDEADIVWKDIQTVYPQVDYSYSNAFGADDINADLEKGLFPIVKVRYRGSGVFHWLMIVGTENGEYMVMDSLADSPIPLSTHGRVYAYRVLHKNA